MSGYQDFSMSNNAVSAYRRGSCPASKIPGVPAELVRHYCEPDEWHHSSKFYNRVDFYDSEKVLAIFGIQPSDDYPVDPAAVSALTTYKVEKRAVNSTTYSGCTVGWVEWTGTRNYPKAKNRQATGCTVEVKGQSATITFSDGQKMVKRLTTNGFKFSQEKTA